MVLILKKNFWLEFCCYWIFGFWGERASMAVLCCICVLEHHASSLGAQSAVLELFWLCVQPHAWLGPRVVLGISDCKACVLACWILQPPQVCFKTICIIFFSWTGVSLVFTVYYNLLKFNNTWCRLGKAWMPGRPLKSLLLCFFGCVRSTG